MRIYLGIFFNILYTAELVSGSTWSEWWTYDGISGPDFWGLVNPDWYLCSKGRRQSPVNISPERLLFDPSLRRLKVVKNRISGKLMNTGHDIRLIFDEPSPQYVNISSGPLAYQYRAAEIVIRFGTTDSLGSEHTIDGITFPAEIQVVGYNSDLYGNLTQAQLSTNGLVIVSLLAQIKDQETVGEKKVNPEFEVIAEHFKAIRFKGQQERVRHIALHDLIPVSDDYVTYEGSLTQPGCQETVTWIIMNKPLYITRHALLAMREVMQGDEGSTKVSVGNNYRPIMPINQRAIRTNINFNNARTSSEQARLELVSHRTNMLHSFFVIVTLEFRILFCVQLVLQ